MKSANCTSITRCASESRSFIPRSRPTTISSQDWAAHSRDRTFVGRHLAQVMGQRADRRDDVERVAVRLHDQRVGVLGHQRVELPQVRRRLQQPLTRHTRLQVLQEHSVIAVGRMMVGLIQQPPVVAGQAVLHREDHAAELAGGDADALLTDQRAHRMKRQQARDDLLGHLDAGLGFGDPRVGVVGLGLRQRARVVDLPRQRWPQRGILGEQVEQDRRPGARLAHDEDRPGDRLGRDVGMSPCAT